MVSVPVFGDSAPSSGRQSRGRVTLESAFMTLSSSASRSTSLHRRPITSPCRMLWIRELKPRKGLIQELLGIARQVAD